MNKTFLALLLPLALTACGQGDDMRYNEAVTPAFLKNVQRIDRDMESLINGDFEAILAGTGAPRVESPASHLGELEHDLNQVQQLRHSEDASRFASNLSHYYELQIGYYQQLKRYVETRDKTKKEALAQDLYTAYRTLHSLPEKILVVQKQFIERATLPH